MSAQDDLLNLHGPLCSDAQKHHVYRDNTETAIYGYSEGVEHALDTVWAKGYRLPRTIREHYGDEGIESLRCGSVILAGITTSTLQSDGTWLDSWGSTYDFYELNLPATVLYEPTP